MSTPTEVPPVPTGASDDQWREITVGGSGLIPGYLDLVHLSEEHKEEARRAYSLNLFRMADGLLHPNWRTEIGSVEDYLKAGTRPATAQTVPLTRVK